MDWPRLASATGIQGRRRLLGSLLAALALVAVAPSVAQARTLVVDDDAGCADARYSTIQSAVNAATPGDDIRVCAGTYPESVNVTKDRLTILSRTRHGAVVQSESPGDTPFVIGAQGTLLRGFTITGDPTATCESRPGGPLIYVFGGSNTIDYNRMTDSGCRDIENVIEIDAHLPGLLTIAYNDLSNFDGTGVSTVVPGPKVSIHSNVIHDGNDGIFLVGGQAVAQDNTIEDNAGAGIRVFGFEHPIRAQISGNRLRRNGEGIVVTDIGSGVQDSGLSSVRVVANGVFDNAGDGLHNEDSLDPVHYLRNRSLGNGGFDCFDRDSRTAATWKDNVGLTDSPPTLCRAP